MSNGNLPLTTVEKIAVRLEGDMRQRDLRPGDRYLTAAEASELFQVNSMTMHRAMRSLAGREMLVRKRNRGTFVGPKFNNSNHVQQAIDVLHVVMAIDYYRTQNFSSDRLVDEFSKAIPGVTIQVHHLIENGALQYIDSQIQRLSSSKREAFVLIRCTREVQHRISESALPAVVFGHVYPGICLPCISHDQSAVGRFMAEYALQQGARRFAFLTHAHWRLGDHRMIDAATLLLGGAGVQLDQVKIRSVAPEREIVREVVREILQCDEPPDAFLCRSDFYAQVVSEMVYEGKTGDTIGDTISNKRGDKNSNKINNKGEEGGQLKSGAKICVVSGSHSPPNGVARFARVVSSLSLSEQVQHIAKLLCQSSEKGVASEEGVGTPLADIGQASTTAQGGSTTREAKTVQTGNTLKTGNTQQTGDECQSLVIPVEFENPVSEP